MAITYAYKSDLEVGTLVPMLVKKKRKKGKTNNNLLNKVRYMAKVVVCLSYQV